MIQLYCPQLSTFGRIATVIAEEKGAPWEVIPTAAADPDHRERHPFGKVPVMDHGDVRLYETLAICIYLDETFDGPALQPTDTLARAEMHKWISVADHYLYPAMMQGIVVPRLVAPLTGSTPNEALLHQALPIADYQCGVLEDGLADRPFFAGDRISLADFYVATMIEALRLTGEGKAMLQTRPRLVAWAQVMLARPSFAVTAPDLEAM